MTTHCLSIVIQVLKKASKKHEKSSISGHDSPNHCCDLAPRPDLPGFARTCPAQRRLGAGIQGIPPHVPMSQSATRPLGRQLAYRIDDSNLGRFSPHCMQIACNYRGLSSSREAPKPHFPSFATLPSENLDFHEKSYFYPARSTSPSPWIPPRWGPLETMKIEGNPFGGTLGARSRSEAALEGARSVLERPKVTEGGPQAAQEPTLDHSGSILERFQGVQSAPRIGRAESRSTFAKIDFFRFGDRFLLDLVSPDASQGRF